MKKFLALLLAVMMIASMSVTAFAADNGPADNVYAQQNATTPTAPSSKEVKVTSKTADGNTPGVVYHVVVTWKELAFEYNFDQNAAAAIWDPASHTYKDANGNALTGSWTTGSITDGVKVNNHSNAVVYVSAAVGANPVNGVTTTITPDNDNELESAEGMAYTTSAEWTCDVAVGGTPTVIQEFTANTVTLTISKTKTTA